MRGKRGTLGKIGEWGNRRSGVGMEGQRTANPHEHFLILK